ncbi:MAG: hypothetical protein DSZ21_02665 [Tenericutes bacterium]|nr:MAG: hypothetical protein DSZ21_02665 [Mycoplasmatota bacterium]
MIIEPITAMMYIGHPSFESSTILSLAFLLSIRPAKVFAKFQSTTPRESNIIGRDAKACKNRK